MLIIIALFMVDCNNDDNDEEIKTLWNSSGNIVWMSVHRMGFAMHNDCIFFIVFNKILQK